jgi:antitoxin ParD1/3/4
MIESGKLQGWAYMSVTVSNEVENRVRPWVESGRYPSADAVILDALQLLEERDLESLRAKLQIGIDQLDRGEGIPYTPELMAELRREAKERIRHGELPDPDVCP